MGLMGLLHPQWHNCLAASWTQRHQRIQSFSYTPAAGQRQHCRVQQAWPSPTQKIYVKPWKDGTGWWYFIMAESKHLYFPLTHSVIYCINNVEYKKAYQRFKYKSCSFDCVQTNKYVQQLVHLHGRAGNYQKHLIILTRQYEKSTFT